MAQHGRCFELSRWGDGTMRLAFWDSLHGHDIILILNEDGTADRARYDDNEDEQLERVELVTFLRQLAGD